MTTPLLEARNLSRTSLTDGKSLLHDVSLVLRAGDRIVLRGESGAGKTVLLRALAAMDSVSGELHRNGAPIVAKENPLHRTCICYLHQNASLPDGTARNALTEPFTWTEHASKSYDEMAVVKWLEDLGRDKDFLDKDAANLSGGESQLVALLRAIQLSPQVLLLDEPTSAIDDKTTQQLEKLLLDWVAEEQRAFVWTTHDSVQAERIATQVIELANGAIVHE